MFNPPGLRAWLGLVPRDHRKLLVIDESIGLTGGVGIGNEWIGKTKRHRGHWRDTAVRIEGPAAHDMQQAFDTMWERAQKRERRGSHRLTRRAARGAHLDPATAAATAAETVSDLHARDGVDAPGWYRLQVLPALVRRAVEDIRRSN